MNITVLFGGPSSEREISLISGRAVAEGLKQAGHQVFASDISPTDLSALDRPCDVVFPVLHGEWGESGELQEILEQRGLCFVGSGSAASRLGMDKAGAKQVWLKHGLPTPAWRIIEQAEDYEQDPPAAPCVIKAVASGSSIDVFVCKTAPEVLIALHKVISRHGRAMVEQYIVGSELTVGILEERALHPIRITTTRDFFDFQAKYKGNDAQHHFDLKLPADIVKRVQSISLKAHQCLGCRDLSRVDVMLDQQPVSYTHLTLPTKA
jgi:D-alanine-D-alanine ligase